LCYKYYYFIIINSINIKNIIICILNIIIFIIIKNIIICIIIIIILINIINKIINKFEKKTLLLLLSLINLKNIVITIEE